ncbi:MAG: hypothetical protein R3F20_03390 [Planctomycetota bacterium]
MAARRSLWISDLPGNVPLEDVVTVLQAELGLSRPCAVQHAANVGAGSIARFTSDDATSIERVRAAFGRLGCRLEDAFESQAS